MTCTTEGKNISGIFITKEPEANWSIHLKYNLPCMFLDFSYRRLWSVLPSLVRIHIYWDYFNILKELIENSVLKVFMIIRVQCQW